MGAWSSCTFAIALLAPLHLGERVLDRQVTVVEARHLSHSPACRRVASLTRPLQVDKFREIETNNLLGACWTLQQIGHASSHGTAQVLDDLLDPGLLPGELLPRRTEGDRLRASKTSEGFWIEALTRESDYEGGWQALLVPLATGDFLGTGHTQLIIWKSFSAIGACYSECEVSLVAKRSGKYVTVRRLPLGHCG